MNSSNQYHAMAAMASATLTRIARLAQQSLGVDAVAVYLTRPDDAHHRAFASVEFPAPSSCEQDLARVLLADDLRVVQDARQRADLSEHPWVAEAPGWSFWASAPLTTPGKQTPIGHLVVADDGRDTLSPDDRAILTDLAGLIVERFELQLSQAEVAGEMDRMITIGILAAGVAHEINNPLSFVGGNLQFALRLLEDDLPDLPASLSGTIDEVTDALQDALIGSRRVRDVVRDLHRLAGRSNGDNFTIEPIDVFDPLSSSLSIARKHIEQRAKLVRNFDDVPAVMGNASKLGQVFLNLLINAAHAIPKGDIAGNRVHVKTSARDGDVVISITDTGTGIDDDTLEHIFKPFFTTKSRNEGTGLGLAISYNIVNALSGDIEIDTTPGEGTTFRVVLPSMKKATSMPSA